MKIALLLPTRERMNLKMGFLMSALARCKDPNNFTIYFGIDADDPTLDRCKKLATVVKNLKVVEFEKMHEKTNIHKLWNILAAASTEEIISMVGDDMVFMTDNWDEQIINEFKRGPEFQLVYLNDDYNKDALCVNAFVPRTYFEKVGYFLSEKFIRNWADQWLYDVFKAIGRLNYLKDVKLVHNHWIYKKMEIDNVALNLLKREGPNKEYSDKVWNITRDERIAEINMWAKELNITPEMSHV